jgi:anti-sigma B factor antagonist
MINFEKRERIDIVTFSTDRINALNIDEIREGIGKVFENPNSKAIIDLKGVNYIDSSGFGCLLSIMRISKNNYGLLKFANPEPTVKQLLTTLYLDTIFQIFDNIEDCISSFR